MHKFPACCTLCSSYETLSSILFFLPDGVTQCLDHYLLLCVADYLSEFLAEKIYVPSVSYFILCISQILYLYFYKRLFCPSNSKSSYKILLLALILSIPVTCLQESALSLPWSSIFAYENLHTSRTLYCHIRCAALSHPGSRFVTYVDLHYHFHGPIGTSVRRSSRLADWQRLQWPL